MSSAKVTEHSVLLLCWQSSRVYCMPFLGKYIRYILSTSKVVWHVVPISNLSSNGELDSSYEIYSTSTIPLSKM